MKIKFSVLALMMLVIGCQTPEHRLLAARESLQVSVEALTIAIEHDALTVSEAEAASKIVGEVAALLDEAQELVETDKDASLLLDIIVERLAKFRATLLKENK